MIFAASPSTYLADNIINNGENSKWQLFSKLATGKGWSDDAHVFSFTEDEWDVVNADQVRQDYAAHGVNQQVRFEKANNTVRTADKSRPTIRELASSKQQSNNGQHHDGNWPLTKPTTW